MRMLLQRVTHAGVVVDDQTVGEIGRGYLVLLGVAHGDTPADADKLCDKLVNLRLFPDDRGRFDRSLLDVEGGVLLVSQFTLMGDARKGRRPSFTDAAHPDQAAPLCDHAARTLRDLGVARVETGVFGADMKVSLCNDGPVTLMLDTAAM